MIMTILLLIIASLLGGCGASSTEEAPPKAEEQKETANEEKESASALQVQVSEDEVTFSNEVLSGKYLLVADTTYGDISMTGKRSFGGITELVLNGTNIVEKGGIIQPWNLYTWRPEFKDAWLYIEKPIAQIVSQSEEEAVVRISYQVKQTEGTGEYKIDFDMKITKSSPVIDFSAVLNRLNAVDTSLKEYDVTFGEVPGFIELVLQTDLGHGPEMNVFVHQEKKVGENQYEDQGVQDISGLEANFDHWHWNKVYGWPNFRTPENWIVFSAPTNDKGVAMVHDGSLKWMTHYGPDHSALVTLGFRSMDELNKLPEWNKAGEPSTPLNFSLLPFVSNTDAAIEEARKLK
jgi:hypothetical protein